MYKELTQMQQEWVNSTLASMTSEEKLCHVLCPHFLPDKAGFERLKRILDQYPIGCAFFLPGDADDIHEMTNYVKANSATPVINAMDIIWGPGHVLKNSCTTFVTPMACGAADSEELSYQMGQATALQGRAHGIHWTLGPVVDINENGHSPIVNFRAYSDKASQVIKMANAFTKGVQEDKLMAATAKHFPGDGVDDRDQHLLTSINSLAEDEWFSSFGQVFKAAIEAGTMAFMSGHIACPAIAPATDPILGPPPASLSKKLLLDCLRKQLGFDGVIISDAVNMTGLLSHVSKADRGHRLIDAGNDVVLFADPELELPGMKRALEEGQLSQARLDDAVKRILSLKCRLNVIDKQDNFLLNADMIKEHNQAAIELGKRSIKVVRDEDNTIPVSLSEKAKILTVTVQFDRNDSKFIFLDTIDDELKRRGYQVDNIKNPPRYKLLECADQYDAVFVNINVGPHARAGVLKLNAHLMGPFEDIALGLPVPAVVTSFGDPYKLYEMPYIRTMVNTFSPTSASQIAAVKVWLGEEKASAKNPIELPGFFEREI